MSSSVSLIVATYGRPEVLRCTLESVLMQDHRNWDAVVVGDHCGFETEEAVREILDPRIRYYNLPDRFGEQSGPNTAGLRLAGGDFIVFLNHDDLMLQDHLSYAIRELERTGRSLFIGLHAKATSTCEDQDGNVAPVFTRLSPKRDHLEQLMTSTDFLLEPCSFWVVRSSLARAVGPWRPARELMRSPLRDWLLRAWRLERQFCLGARLTGLRFSVHNTTRTARYSLASPEHRYMLAWMSSHAPEETRRLILDQVATEAVTASGRLRLANLRRIGLPTAGLLYRATGFDAVMAKAWVRGRRPGDLLERMLPMRTGETLPTTPSIVEFLADPEAYRVV